MNKLRQSLELLLVERKASAKFIERLRGRLNGGGQLFGRLAKWALSCKVIEGLVTDEAVEAISLCLDLLVKRALQTGDSGDGAALLLFTDAAYKGQPGVERCGMGGVLLDTNGKP